jgi:oligogalacturonide lyase
MSKGSTFPSEHSVSRDERTGAIVRQLTAHESINHATYFLNQSFTADQKTLIFTSYRRGPAQLFELGYPDGEIRQLTDGPAIHPFSPAISPSGEVFFVRGGAVWAIDRTTLAERRVADFLGQLGECSLSPDGSRYVAACRRDGEWGIAVGRTNGLEGEFIPFPRTIIHPQFNPADPTWIEFAADPAPRMHRVRINGKNLECLYEHDNDEFVVHETFLGDSSDLVFTVWPHALKRMDWRTRQIKTIARTNAWHITPNRDGTKVLYDTVHPDRGLQLIDVATGEETTICYPQASSQGTQWKTSRYAVAADWEAARASAEKGKSLSWMEMATDSVYGPQWTHPHPSFSPDEKLVAFASDRTGHTQVYVVEIPGATEPQA